VPRLKREYRYQLLIKATGRKALRETLDALRRFTEQNRWPATALVIDVDPLTLL
jgi:primosomal protein N' (replication factor Y)